MNFKDQVKEELSQLDEIEVDIVQQYLAESAIVKSQEKGKIQEVSIAKEQYQLIKIENGVKVEEYFKIEQFCTTTNLSQNQKQLKVKIKRIKDHNSCKKVNLFAFNCLKSLVYPKDLKLMKKSIHRLDFFVTVLLIAHKLQVSSQFQDKYLDQQSELRRKLLQQMRRWEVKQFFMKTLQAIKIFRTGDIDRTIHSLFDLEKLKCRTYLEQSKIRIKDLYELANEQNANQIYLKRRTVKKTNCK